jgi:serine/threonine-protein kinase
MPVEEGPLGAKLIAIQFQDPKSIRDFRPDIDPHLEKIVGRMMAKDPAKRYQSAQEVISALKGWLSRPVKKAATDPPSIRIKTAKKSAAADTLLPMAEAIGDATARAIRRKKLFAWSFRAAMVALVLTATALLKPWHLLHRTSAQAAPPAASK